MPRYQLRRPFWDGVTLHPAKAIIHCAKDEAPKTAVNLDKDPEAETVEKPREPEPDTLAAMTPKAPGEKPKAEAKKA